MRSNTGGCENYWRFPKPIRYQSNMNPKTTVILLLLSIFSVYFLCPVLCPSLGTQTCSVFTVSQPKNQGIASVSQFSETHSSSSTCCRTRNRETTPDNDSDERNDTCCFDHLGILKASEYQRFSQTLERSLPLVAVIASCLEVRTFFTYSTTVLGCYAVPILDPPSYQIFPRAPPFSLA